MMLIIALPGMLKAVQLPAPETRGVWVTGNYISGGLPAIEQLVENVAAAHLNVIYIDVWYEGSTIYPSSVVPAAGGPVQNPSFVGKDPLKTLITVAHQHGIEVFAWFEYGLAVGMGADSTDVPNILKVHPDWSMAARDTSRHFQYDAGDNIYLFWLDPAVPAVSDFMVSLFKECAQKYPDLDGIELDRLRYPNTDYSYSAVARQLYKSQYGVDPLTLSDRDSSWAQWRRDKVNNIVRKIYQAVKSVNPSCVVSGAVDPWGLPGLPSDNLQQWNAWADGGYVDALEPETYWDIQSYKAEVPHLRTIVPDNFYLYSGIALNHTGSAENTIQEIEFARADGWEGETFWYYGYLENYGYVDSLVSEVYPTETLPSHDDLLVDNTTAGAFSTEGTWTKISGGYQGSYDDASSSGANSATYSFRILRSGRYMLYGYWSGDSSGNSSAVELSVSSPNIARSDTINEKTDLNTWNYVDVFDLASGDTVHITVKGVTPGNVIADAFRLRRTITLALEDEAVPDSSHVLLKFNQDLMDPLASCTKIYFQDSTGTPAQAYVDNGDNSVLHIAVPSMRAGNTYTLWADNLVSSKFDTLSLKVSVSYQPDSTILEADNSSTTQFTGLGSSWKALVDTGAVGGSCLILKQSGQVARAQWGPMQVRQDGYYDVYASIPPVSYPLSRKCLYIVLNHAGSDSVVTSQTLATGGWLKLGEFQYVAGEDAAIMLSSLSGADTGRYLVADAVMLKRSVQVSSVENSPLRPKRFALSQNYPNPFNPTTTISYELPTAGYVSLKVYDVLGRLVKTLVAGMENPGEHRIVFNAARYASGVYFFRLTEGAHSAVRKMLMLK